MPKRNKIEMQGLVERICNMYFNEKKSHKEITAILKEEGYDISKSGVGRTLIDQAAQTKSTFSFRKVIQLEGDGK